MFLGMSLRQAPGIFELPETEPEVQSAPLPLAAELDFAPDRTEGEQGDSRETRCVTVRVTDALGAPLAGIGLWGDEGDSSFEIIRKGIPSIHEPPEPDSRIRCYSDSHGFARLEVGPEAKFVTAIWHKEPGWICDDREITASREITGDRCLIEMPFGVVSGFLRLRNGDALPNEVVWALDGEEKLSATKTRGDGSFLIRVPSAGSVSLVFMPELGVAGDGLTVGRTCHVELEEARVGKVSAGDEGVELWTRRHGNDGSVSVLLLDPEERPISGVLVWAHQQSRCRRIGTHTNVQGRARLSGLTTLPQCVAIDVRASERDWLPLKLEPVSLEGQELVIRFRAGHRIRGQVLTGGGGIAAGAKIQVEPPGDGPAGEKADADGRFEMLLDPATAPWRFTFEWTDESGQPWRAEERIGPDESHLQVLLRR